MKPVAFFDSGIGGLTVLHEAMQLMPNERYIYFCDRLNAPYGNKPADLIRRLTLDNASFIDRLKPKALVVACNTATSVVVHELRQYYDYPVIGMEPAVKPASELEKAGRILVVATERTLNEEKLERLISGLNLEDRVERLAMPELVQLAEKAVFDDALIASYLNEKFNGIDWAKFSSIVMGCTHFSYYKKHIKDAVAPHVQILDGNKGTAKRLRQLISPNVEALDFPPLYYESGIQKDWSSVAEYWAYLNSSFSPQSSSL